MSHRTAEPLNTPSYPPAPAISTQEARAIARDVFGLTVAASPLDGEQDRNFQLLDDAGRCFVMKLSNAADRELIELQNAALCHVASAGPDCIVPRVARSLDGRSLVEVELEGRATCFARVLTFVRGQSIGELALSARQFRRIGEAIARLDTALSSFHHEATRGAMVWNICKASDARPLLELMKNVAARDCAERTLDRFEARQEELGALRSQFIHHDLNPGNVIALSGQENCDYGVIDFGDITHAPLIGELAVAAAYNVAAEGHPLSAIRAMLSGYSSVIPLRDEEIGVLFSLISVRLVQSLAISHWRAKITPMNSAYLLRYGDKASRDLRRLAMLSEEEARAYLCDR